MPGLNRKPNRVLSALAAVFGAVLAAFEVGRVRQGEGAAWFWLAVAALMIVLGLIGVFQKGTGES